ncbi:MAG TPA: response regulator [Steroidobacteraceae bacterium]|nr:response regulator [Steroidobacteraceae bacterium]
MYLQRITPLYYAAARMASGLDLAGRLIAVIEDDFYIADDAKRALEGAGAIVLGPFAEPTPALTALRGRRCDCAVVDLNLGTGPSFELTREILTMRMPVVICTGYDLDIMPPELQHVPILQKPVNVPQLLAAVSRACID